MTDKILEMFFDIARWEKAIEKGVGKDIRKDQLILLTDENTRLQIADAMLKGKYEISPPISPGFRRTMASFVQFT